MMHSEAFENVPASLLDAVTGGRLPRCDVSSLPLAGQRLIQRESAGYPDAVQRSARRFGIAQMTAEQRHAMNNPKSTSCSAQINAFKQHVVDNFGGNFDAALTHSIRHGGL